MTARWLFGPGVPGGDGSRPSLCGPTPPGLGRAPLPRRRPEPNKQPSVFSDCSFRRRARSKRAILLRKVIKGSSGSQPAHGSVAVMLTPDRLHPGLASRCGIYFQKKSSGQVLGCHDRLPGFSFRDVFPARSLSEKQIQRESLLLPQPGIVFRLFSCCNSFRKDYSERIGSGSSSRRGPSSL